MINYNINGAKVSIVLQGDFINKIHSNDIESLYKLINNAKLKDYEILLDSISEFDISFIFLLLDYCNLIKKHNKKCTLIDNTPIAKQITQMLSSIEIKQKQIVRSKKDNIFLIIFNNVESKIKHSLSFAIDFTNFIGYLFYMLLCLIFNPKKIRINAISYHIYSGVITAMPVIFMVSFIIGGVIAYQGAATLERMGFMQAAVTMTAALTLREIGPFVVALIVAGRSASSYTAQIGVMKITDELNAMRTMNFNLFYFIVLPRFIALVLSFPLMVFLSDLISIFGCMIFLHYGFGIAFGDYIFQLKMGVSINSFWTGIIKAPFYAATIVVIGCFIGFRVEDNTQSVGERTTQSVVYALFGVIVVNAIFSLIFTELKF